MHRPIRSLLPSMYPYLSGSRRLHMDDQLIGILVVFFWTLYMGNYNHFHKLHLHAYRWRQVSSLSDALFLTLLNCNVYSVSKWSYCSLCTDVNSSSGNRLWNISSKNANEVRWKGDAFIQLGAFLNCITSSYLWARLDAENCTTNIATYKRKRASNRHTSLWNVRQSSEKRIVVSVAVM